MRSALASHGEEIDLVLYYGSHAQGVATEQSDLDLCYVPADGASPPIARTVLVQKVLFDFWPVSWEMLAGFASGRARGWAHAPALVHHARVLHSRSAAALARLGRLKQQVLDLQQPAARPEMLGRARVAFLEVSARLGSLHLAGATADLSEVRQAAWVLIAAVMECLALANQVVFDRATSVLPGCLPALDVRPPDLERLVRVVATFPAIAEVLAAGDELAAGVRQALRQAQPPGSPRSPGQVLGDAYPELRDQLRKLLTACEAGEALAAGMAASSLRREAVTMLALLDGEAPDSYADLLSDLSGPYRRLGLPDLAGCDLNDLAALAARGRYWDERLRGWLVEQGVSLNEYETVEEFAASLA